MAGTHAAPAAPDRLYKWLSPDGSCIWGQGSWYLPTPTGPGKWMPTLYRESLRSCKYGYHAFHAADLDRLMPPDPHIIVAVGLVLPVQESGKWISHRGRVLRVLDLSWWDYGRLTDVAWGNYSKTRSQSSTTWPDNRPFAEHQYRQELDTALANVPTMSPATLTELQTTTQEATCPR